jgi:hypothetical protein
MTLKSGQTPLQRFSATAVRPKVLDFHPPFCPIYVLHNGLQGSGSPQTSGSDDPDVLSTLESHLYMPGQLLLS